MDVPLQTVTLKHCPRLQAVALTPANIHIDTSGSKGLQKQLFVDLYFVDLTRAALAAIIGG
jgi:hypothetical protein